MIPLLLLVTSCASVDIRSEQPSRQRASQFRTFSWDQHHSTKGDASSDFAPMQDALMQSVNKEMAAKGYQQVQRGPGDMVLRYSINIVVEESQTPSRIIDSQQPESHILSFGGNGGVHLDPHAETSTPQEVETATLVISLNRQGLREPLWVGVAEGDLLKALPMDVRKQRLRNILTKMFSSLPATAR